MRAQPGWPSTSKEGGLRGSRLWRHLDLGHLASRPTETVSWLRLWQSHTGSAGRRASPVSPGQQPASSSQARKKRAEPRPRSHRCEQWSWTSLEGGVGRGQAEPLTWVSVLRKLRPFWLTARMQGAGTAEVLQLWTRKKEEPNMGEALRRPGGGGQATRAHQCISPPLPSQPIRHRSPQPGAPPASAATHPGPSSIPARPPSLGGALEGL